MSRGLVTCAGCAAVVVAVAAAPARAQVEGQEPGAEEEARASARRPSPEPDSEASSGEADDATRLEALEQALRRERARRRDLEQRIAELARSSEEGREEREALRRELALALAREREARRELENRLEEAETFRAQAAHEHTYLTQRLKVVEEAYPSTEVADADDRIVMGGAVWLNYAFREFSDGDREKGGELNFDLFRITVDGTLGGLLLSAQYRYYPFMHAVHHAWAGVSPAKDWQVRFGVTQVPFGILPFASHSYWFGLPYYLGLEDDYDVGVRAIYDHDPWNLQLAAFKNPEFSLGSDLNRYSFDVVAPEGDPRGDEEANQVNARATYTAKLGGAAVELGASAQAGRLYDATTDDVGTRWAAAAHANAFVGPWNAQLEVVRFGAEAAGADDGLLTLGAFGAQRSVAAEGLLVVANLARSMEVDLGPVKTVTCYDDWSAVFKQRGAFDDSWLNTLGCSVQAGPTYTFVDVIVGRNATFLNDGAMMSGLGAGGSGEPELRVNVNWEYFF